MSPTENKPFNCSDTKKNIFLIGDSIRMGYRNEVKDLLSDKAEVFFVDDNCRSTQHIMMNLWVWVSMFSDTKKVDLVHFNCGHWDANRWLEGGLPLTSEEEYGRNIEIIIKMLAKEFPNAKIVFATTTPMNPNPEMAIDSRTTPELIRYNEVAKEVVTKNNIPINDLFEVTKDWDASCYADYCHYTEDTNKTLGKIVAEALELYI